MSHSFGSSLTASLVPQAAGDKVNSMEKGEDLGKRQNDPSTGSENAGDAKTPAAADSSNPPASKDSKTPDSVKGGASVSHPVIYSISWG